MATTCQVTTTDYCGNVKVLQVSNGHVYYYNPRDKLGYALENAFRGDVNAVRAKLAACTTNEQLFGVCRCAKSVVDFSMAS